MKIAVVASGWHFPYDFYESMSRQLMPKGSSFDMYCISHRAPDYSRQEKEGLNLIGDDLIMYRKFATIKDIENLGWKYEQHPNTIGDWGCSNQWLEKYDYKKYDLLLFTHDDNFIKQYKWLGNAIYLAEQNWEILCNSCGDPKGWIRGSCEFFKPSLLDKIGGKFDLSMVKLNREGEVTSPDSWHDLFDWNNTVHPLMKFAADNNIQIGYMSNTYRHSVFVSEGERGFINPIVKK